MPAVIRSLLFGLALLTSASGVAAQPAAKPASPAAEPASAPARAPTATPAPAPRLTRYSGGRDRHAGGPGADRHPDAGRADRAECRDRHDSRAPPRAASADESRADGGRDDPAKPPDARHDPDPAAALAPARAPGQSVADPAHPPRDTLTERADPPGRAGNDLERDAEGRAGRQGAGTDHRADRRSAGGGQGGRGAADDSADRGAGSAEPRRRAGGPVRERPGAIPGGPAARGGRNPDPRRLPAVGCGRVDRRAGGVLRPPHRDHRRVGPDQELPPRSLAGVAVPRRNLRGAAGGVLGGPPIGSPAGRRR